jgi:LmbE family N-acetylglucosaminyl deacetylase|eukprot:Stramenopile-MAST_4_protein_4468
MARFVAIALLLLIPVFPSFARPPAGEPVPLPIETFAHKRILFITAHPDDVEGYAGGTVAALQKSGLDVEIKYLIVTSGNAGGLCYNDTAHYECDSETNKEELALLRRLESLNAAKYLGVSKVFRMGLDDGLSVAYHETRIRRAFTAYIRSFKPHVVMTHFPNPIFAASPTCNFDCPSPNGWDDLGYHPDHQHVGKLVFDTVYGSGSAADNDKLFHDLAGAGHLDEWKVEQLYFFALTKSQPITHFVSLDETLLAMKVRAQSLHKSQYQEPPLNTTTWVAQQIGKAVGVSMAEGFLGFF